MSEKTGVKKVILLVGATALLAAGAAFGATALLVNIFQHKVDAEKPFFRVVEIDDDTDDPAVWGKNFPLQYDSYKKTVDMQRTRHGGSEAHPRVPDAADPRTVVSQSKVEEDPRLSRMWNGYSFAVDFREERGHAYMLTDQMYTERQIVAAQPGTCLNCHASTYNIYKDLGDGDIMKGFHELNKMPYADASAHAEHPVSCIDCHDADTMQLRVTRPAFMEGIKLVKNDPEYEVNTMATHQEMRSYVCAQCHVEYYFKGEGKTLTFPWSNGTRGDDILEYYESIEFKDWTHKTTKAPMLKAQHPEFETWSQGIHSRAGVSCADCHMPYERVGAMKVSDHHVRSPLLNINNACQTCHKVPEEELLGRAETIQARHLELRDHALDALMDLIDEIAEAMETGATDDQLEEARNFQRKATFLLDFAEAENSAGFHADQEGARLLGLSMDYSRKGWKSINEVWKERAGEVAKK